MNLEDGKITQEMDVIAYADIYTAFSENRPYREGLKADEILNSLENSNKKEPVKEQLSFDFEEKKEKPKDILEGIDILNTTPIEALNILYKLKENK